MTDPAADMTVIFKTSELKLSADHIIQSALLFWKFDHCRIVSMSCVNDMVASLERAGDIGLARAANLIKAHKSR